MKIHSIAFYLPQFHPIPENNAWWGEGFTEWTNVARAKPLFSGHRQPNLPANLGFYDLRLDEVRERQAELARDAGISAFCYYSYWFSGQRLLHRPLDAMLASKSPNFPFCLCYANENWTRRWDGAEDEVLMKQQHSPEDDRRYIRSLFSAMEDPRYFRFNGKPLLLVYRTELLPDARHTAEIWREEARKAGIGELYLARVESFNREITPTSIGFDAAVDFPPLRGGHYPIQEYSDGPMRVEYHSIMRAHLDLPVTPYPRFPGVIPKWDNTPRRQNAGLVVTGSNPRLYGQWLESAIDRSTREALGGEAMVFINAWNEWGEGAYLEPDQATGMDYLQTTSMVMHRARSKLTSQGRLSHDQQIEAYQRSIQAYSILVSRLEERLAATELRRVARASTAQEFTGGYRPKGIDLVVLRTLERIRGVLRPRKKTYRLILRMSKWLQGRDADLKGLARPSS